MKPWLRTVLLCNAAKSRRKWDTAAISVDFNKHDCQLSTFKHHVSAYSRKVHNHYDILGVTPKSSQAQIKAAYYRLSKKYHPDTNTEGHDHVKFAEIAEAYEVLKNKSKRHLYDKGMFSRGSAYHETVDMEYREFMRRQGQFGKRSSAPTGRTYIYDFDEFYRQHYGEAIKQKQKQNFAREKHEREMQEFRDERKQHIFVYVFVLMFITALIFTSKKS